MRFAAAISCVGLLWSGPAHAQSDEYYAAAEGLEGEALQAALHEIVRGHQRFGYREVWRILEDVDGDPTDPTRVILFYTGRSQAKSDRVGPGNDHGDAWNREHLWPKSHGFPAQGTYAFTDVHHLRPADKSVNQDRGNLDFDAGGAPNPEATGARSDGDSFEPPDRVKGDAARALFYMAVRYEGTERRDTTPDLRLVDHSNTSGPELGELCTLLSWHQLDPPSDRERARNDAIEARWQKNRNPFVDRPEFADAIWGDPCDEPPSWWERARSWLDR